MSDYADLVAELRAKGDTATWDQTAALMRKAASAIEWLASGRAELLRIVREEAWDEGFDAACDDWDHHEERGWEQECSPEAANPYSSDGDSRITRIEIIDDTGRAFSRKYSDGDVFMSIQDDGRTLKVFAGKPESGTGLGCGIDQWGKVFHGRGCECWGPND